MKIVINLPEEMIERIKDGYVPLGLSRYLKNGIPLPEGHGDLYAKGFGEAEKELDKLHKWLVDNAKMYGWTIKREDADTHLYDTHQIVIYRKDVRLFDVICHRGSYGYTEGLLEIMGDIVDEEKAGDSVEGFLTANGVIKRVKARYGEGGT